MEILEFLIGAEQMPVYRTVTPQEAELLRTLLGAAGMKLKKRFVLEILE